MKELSLSRASVATAKMEMQEQLVALQVRAGRHCCPYHSCLAYLLASPQAHADMHSPVMHSQRCSDADLADAGHAGDKIHPHTPHTPPQFAWSASVCPARA
jgi:hypothetical protein